MKKIPALLNFQAVELLGICNMSFYVIVIIFCCDLCAASEINTSIASDCIVLYWVSYQYRIGIVSYRYRIGIEHLSASICPKSAEKWLCWYLKFFI